MQRFVAYFWGIGGILLLLGFAVFRLAGTAAEAFNFELLWYHWLLLLLNLAMMIYYEAYKGFHLAFSPRAAARAKYLSLGGGPVNLLLAPIFCMAYYATSRKRKIATWVLTIAIVVLILLFQQLPQPIRGILDVGVVVGLGLGIVSTLVHTLHALDTTPVINQIFKGSKFDHDPEVTFQPSSPTSSKSGS